PGGAGTQGRVQEAVLRSRAPGLHPRAGERDGPRGERGHPARQEQEAHHRGGGRSPGGARQPRGAPGRLAGDRAPSRRRRRAGRDGRGGARGGRRARRRSPEGCIRSRRGGAGGGGPRRTAMAPLLFSERLACADCGISLPEVSPRMFSFNNPYGACPECGGIGTRYEIDPDRLVPNGERSLKQGALAAWAGRESPYFKQTLAVLAKRYGFSLDTPLRQLKKTLRAAILHSD